MVRDRLKTATGELVEQKERTNQLETLNARHAEQLQALSENFAQAGADFSLAKSANDDLVALRAQVTTLEHQLNDTEGMANDLRIRLRNQEKSSKEELDKALARASELQQHLTATKTQLQSRSQSYDEVSVQLDALRESESSLKHRIQLLTEYEAEVMQLRITKAENACIPSLRARIEELLGSKTSLETEVEALKAIYTDLGRLRGVELQFALANGQIANLEDQVKTLQTNLSLEQEKAIQCTTLKESAVSEAEKLVARIESATIANQESMTRIKLLEQEVQQQAAELARKEKEYINTISQSKTEVDRKEEIIASFSHEIDKAAKATSKVQSELASVQSKLADAEKLSAVTAAKLDSADSTISDLREQHTGLMTQNTSLASELASLKARESETNLTLRSVVVEKDEIREKLAERNSAISQCRTDIARLTSQLEESQSKMEEYRETARLVPELQRHISDSQHQLDTFASRYRAGRELVGVSLTL
ncbi:uncharacterized protein EI90DRAFT_1748763 [Cantharellus anzutake]|uniref:uncharacterized protein n=1 Tax=Cantharellus anzutake TaxID=1750568 RepID=UPI0019076159|nr:uncharacterized protein EI90DRAFT_1748763 [Cantharellus anzutake]KAF8341529.1 hypothetical protein EI90DRAFT_1748763 [Cantharellus anzutake]